MRVLLVIDDQAESKASVAHWLANEIGEMTQGKYVGMTIEGVRIALALPLVKAEASQISARQGSLEGLVIDLCDKGDPKAGFSLAGAVRGDPDLANMRIVIYTGKHMEIDYGEARRLAVKVIRRKATGGRAGDMGRQVLDAFGIPHK